MLLVILMAKKSLERLTKKQLQKTNQKEFRIEKAIKTKWKVCNNSFNSWID